MNMTPADTAAVVQTVSPLWLLLYPAGGLCIYLLLKIIQQMRRRVEHYHGKQFRPSIGTHHHTDSFVHRWDPRVKVLAIGVYLFVVAALGSLPAAVAAVVISLLGIYLSRLPYRLAITRTGAITLFLAMLFVVMPLSARTLPGDVLFAFERVPLIRINPRGLQVAALAYTKALAIVLMTVPLLSTQRFDVMVRALEKLGMPNRFLQLILFTYRYIYVLWDEKLRMQTAMESRGFASASPWRSAQGTGNFIGVLLVRSYERTQHVLEAMLSRGYKGKLLTDFNYRIGGWDLAKGAVVVVVCAGLVVMDRLIGMH